MGRRRKITLSQGEARCGDWLRQYGLDPIPQFRIALLPRYRYDYYFTYQDREYLLEFDGEQHFTYNSWFHRSNKSFQAAQKRDLLKSTVALLSGYYLIRIAHQDLPRFDEILEKAFSSQSRLCFSKPERYLHLTSTKIPPIWLRRYGKDIIKQYLETIPV